MNTDAYPMDAASCQTCFYYRHQDKGCGSCHRYPPGFAGDASPKENHHWRFPLVHDHDWCGEYRAMLPALS